MQSVSGIYLHSISTNLGYGDLFGTMIQPRSMGIRGLVANGVSWALDNDCFNGGLDEPAWIEVIERYQPFTATCLFATVPDVVGDAKATLCQFDKYQSKVRQYGYPVAIVTQDGMVPNNIPWDAIDAVFIGGTDKHKLGPEVTPLMHAALEHKKWLHI